MNINKDYEHIHVPKRIVIYVRSNLIHTNYQRMGTTINYQRRGYHYKLPKNGREVIIHLEEIIIYDCLTTDCETKYGILT